MEKLIKRLVNELPPKDWTKLQNEIRRFPNFDHSTLDADCFFLALLVKKYKPKNILEIGTFVGKSTYSLARVAHSNGKQFNIDTIDVQNKCLKKINKIKQVKFHKGHSSKVLLNLKKKYDFIFVDANLDDETAKILKNLVKLKTLIVIHDFFPPIDKGIYNLFYLSKYFNFYYYSPTIDKSLINKINPYTTVSNFPKDYRVDKNKINLCCCLASFKSINQDKSLNLTKKIKGNNLIFKILLINFVFFDLLFSFKKRILIYSFFNKIIVIDRHEKKIITSIANKEQMYLQKIYFVSDTILKFLFKIKHFLFRFKIQIP